MICLRGISSKVLLLHVLVLLIAQSVHAWVNPVNIKNYKFFDSKTGVEFQVKGVDYYPRPNKGDLNVNNYDFFSDEHEDIWTPDVANFVKLGVNTIRLYGVDPSKSHDKFMCALSEAGIYVIVDMSASCENCAITKDPPPTCYSPDLFVRGQEIYNAFAVYDNLLAFSATNENNHIGKASAPCTKAFLRDIINYADNCIGSIRRVPIGVTAADMDTAETKREHWAEYYNCNPEGVKNTRAEWVGWNTYAECDNHPTYETSVGYQQLVQVFKRIKYPLPVLLVEYGCNIIKQSAKGTAYREFHEAKYMFTSEMNDYIQGGCVFEYSSEKANIKIPYPFDGYDAGKFGLGHYSPDTCDHKATKCDYVPSTEFEALSGQYKAVPASKVTLSNFSPDTSRAGPSKCPASIPSTEIPATPTKKPLECSTRRPLCKGKETIGPESKGNENILKDKGLDTDQNDTTVLRASKFVILVFTLVLLWVGEFYF